MSKRYLYRPALNPERIMPSAIEWGYAETPPHAPMGRPGVLPSNYDFGIIWVERMLTREECQRLRVVPHRQDVMA